MTDKTVTIADVERISIATLLERSHPSHLQGRGAAFKLELPCGCVRTYVLSLVEENFDGCGNANVPTDPRQVN